MTLSAARAFGLILILAFIVPFCVGLSRSARRIQSSFTLVPYGSNTSTPPPTQFAPACPLTISFNLVATYKGINPADRSSEYDGILWENLLVNGRGCRESTTSDTATYFIVPQRSQPDVSPDEETPWFLQGYDNSALECEAYSAVFPHRYYFTDDLPRFQSRLIRSGFLTADRISNSFRDDVYLFVRAVDPENDVTSQSVCVLVKDSEPEPVAPAPTESDSGAACLSAAMTVHTSSRTVPVSMLRPGLVLVPPSGDSSPPDQIIGWSHYDTDVWHRFIQLTLHIAEMNRTSKLELTSGHYVYLASSEVSAVEFVKVGELLLTPSRGVARVVARRVVTGRGLFGPLSTSGRLVVSHVVISCYTEAVAPTAAHALLTPVRASARWLPWRVPWLRVIDALRSLLY